MAKELTDINKATVDVRDEVAIQKNTATRVGGGGPSTLPLASASERLKRNFMQETADY